MMGAVEFFKGEAWWIWSGEGVHHRAGCDPGATYESRWFRHTFEVGELGATFRAAVTADSIYLLWLNGHLVSRGPGRGDVRHHFYDTLDLTPHLRPGTNELRALVVDYSTVACFPAKLGAPAAVMTYRGGFAFEGWLGGGEAGRLIASGADWRVKKADSRRFVEPDLLFGGFVGYFEEFDAERWSEEWGGEEWRPAVPLYPALRIEDVRDAIAPYGLCPRITAPLAEGAEKLFAGGFREGGDPLSAEEVAWCSGQGALTVPAGVTRVVILDAGELMTAFPVVEARGEGGRVALVYAEALRIGRSAGSKSSLQSWGSLESVANENADGQDVWTFDRRGRCLGYGDTLLTSGDFVRYEPLCWRTFRFVRIEVTAGSSDMVIRTPHHRLCENGAGVLADFRSDVPWVNEIWARSVRTVRCCTHETFEDCPYYEQLQYAGDSQIISKLHLYLTGDPGLTRQALQHFDWSRLPEGVTASRYPCRLPQVIPSWSLHWIGMAKDYYLHTADDATARGLLPGIRQTLDWFRRHRDESGLPARLPFWNCVDWTPGWDRGQPPGWDIGPTCVISCQFLQALRDAVQLHRWLGEGATADEIENEADSVVLRIRDIFWDEGLGAFRDSPVRTSASSSILANAWAICAGVAQPPEYVGLRRALAGWSPANVSFFGMYWVFQARRILSCHDWGAHLFPWREMLDTELTTWPEDTAFWRSLCHAWSAHPIEELVGGIFGLQVLEPGWRLISLDPHMGSLETARITLPTPHGLVEMGLDRAGGGIALKIRHPSSIALRPVGDARCTGSEVLPNGTLIETWTWDRGADCRPAHGQSTPLSAEVR